MNLMLLTLTLTFINLLNDLIIKITLELSLLWQLNNKEEFINED